MKHVAPIPGGAAVGKIGLRSHRPDARVLNETIPLFFISRDANGCWIVSDPDGRTSRPFLFKRSALDFVESKSARSGRAVMFIDGPSDLNGPTKLRSFVGWSRELLRLRGRAASNNRRPKARAIFSGRRP